jgi:hypothetical protein
MSAASTPADSTGRITLTGRIESRLLAAGSKSEHQGVVLVAADGRAHALRRAGGNPFRDPALEALVGRSVTLSGQWRDTFFLVERLPDAP